MFTIAPGEVAPPIEAYRLQARLVSIAAGLHLIRYASSKDEVYPPVILVQIMPEDSSQVALLSSKENHASSLVSPGDAIVVRAQRDVRIVVTTASVGSFGLESAIIKIERIDQSAARNSMASTASVDLIGGRESNDRGGIPAGDSKAAQSVSVAVQKKVAR